MHHLFIINPAAGKKNIYEIIEYIHNYFNKDYKKYTIILTEYKGHATNIVKENLKDKKYCIYAAGGDGTVNEVLNGIMQADISFLHALGIIPLGSGNDFIRSLDSAYNKTVIRDIKNLIKTTIEGNLKETDILMVDNRYFLNVASAGFDAKVVYNSLKLKKLSIISPKLSYFISVLYSFINIESYFNYIEIDDMPVIQKKILFIAVGNGKYYGGGMKVLPNASINDDMMDICIVDELSRRRLLYLFPGFIKGTHLNASEVTIIRAKQIKLITATNQRIQIDGELIRHNKNIEIKISPVKINILVPNNLRD